MTLKDVHEKPLAEQVAVVSGAARGIGEAISLRLASLGAHVILTARDKDKLEAVEAAIHRDGGSASTHPVDLRDAAAVEALGLAVRERYQRCDILINNAGVGRLGKPLHQMTLEQWDETLETNLRGPFLLIRAFAELMIERRSGEIINISSLAGKNPLPKGVAYSASKWGLNGLTYGVAEELREYGIRVTAVAPGSVNTAFGAGNADAERAAKKIQPDDLADVVEMLVRQPQRTFVSEVLMRPTFKS